MSKQTTHTVLMVRPASFRRNEETAVNNFFQKELKSSQSDVLALAQKEFDDFVQLLRSNNIHVIVINDIKEQDTPDALFPNNWISFHEHGKVILYPMFAVNRRRERRLDLIQNLKNNGYTIDEVIDLSSAESDDLFLEGTGSLILDRQNRKAYCAISPRASLKLVEDFCKRLDYKSIPFIANQTVEDKRLPIYHTNVMMCIGNRFTVVCLDSIDNIEEKELVKNSLLEDNKEIIEISEVQVNQFAGNMLEVNNKNGDSFLVMSKTAKNSLTSEQLTRLVKYSTIIAPDLNTIELLGGGSARCMLAEVFLRK